MKQNYGLLFGPLAAVILALGVALLPLMIPGYSQIHQTVSEIGEVDSPARVPFALMLYAVALCILIFASTLRKVSIRSGHSPLAAYLTGCMALSVVGVSVFAYPHPLHGYFGLSELIGYQAPLALALTSRRDSRSRSLARMSWVLSILMWVAIALNLSTLDRSGSLWAYERPVYGLVQRSLFVVWFGWCTIVGVILFRD